MQWNMKNLVVVLVIQNGCSGLIIRDSTSRSASVATKQKHVISIPHESVNAINRVKVKTQMVKLQERTVQIYLTRSAGRLVDHFKNRDLGVMGSQPLHWHFAGPFDLRSNRANTMTARN